MRKFRMAALAGALVLLTACGNNQPAAKQAAIEPTPDVYKVKFATSKGDFVVQVTKDWAPQAAERFYLLVREGFYDGARFFRVRPRFVVQFGINGDPRVHARWGNAVMPDDKVKQSNKRGYLSFAQSGPTTRTTQVFINMVDNKALDKDGFAPFGQVIEGMETVQRFYSSYGEMAPRGQGPDPARLEREGNRYLEVQFPRLDYIERATRVK